jgi:hypothetical protein
LRGDVLNLIPPMRAGVIAHASELADWNESWCPVDWVTLESTRLPRVHVLGDATLSAPGMPKSGHMANQHGKRPSRRSSIFSPDVRPSRR